MAARAFGLVALTAWACVLRQGVHAQLGCAPCPFGVGAAGQLCAVSAGAVKAQRGFESACALQLHNCLNAGDEYILKNNGACALQIANKFNTLPVQTVQPARPTLQAKQSWPVQQQLQPRAVQQQFYPTIQTQTWSGRSAFAPAQQYQSAWSSQQSQPWAARSMLPTPSGYFSPVASSSRSSSSVQPPWQQPTYRTQSQYSPYSRYTGTNNGYTGSTNGYSSSNNGYVGSNNGYTVQNNGFVGSNNGYTVQNNGYSSTSNGYAGFWGARQPTIYQPVAFSRPTLFYRPALLPYYTPQSSSSGAPWRSPFVSPFAIVPPTVLAPAVPAPIAPAPIVPAPIVPAPIVPAPIVPAPIVPAPIVPAPIVPAPIVPAPIVPAPIVPAPIVPAPVVPATPAPTTPVPMTLPPTTVPPTTVPPTTIPPTTTTTTPAPVTMSASQALTAAVLNYDSWQCSTKLAPDNSTIPCVLTSTPPVGAPASTNKGCGWQMPTFCDDAVNAMAVSITAAAAPETAPPGYTLLPGMGYYKFHPESVTWYAAKAACLAEGVNTHLVVPGPASDYTDLMAFADKEMPSHYGFWVGFEDEAVYGTYNSATGQPACTLPEMVFNPGDPSGGPGERCLLLEWFHTPGMRDLGCSGGLPFICEQTLASKTTTCLP